MLSKLLRFINLYIEAEFTINVSDTLVVGPLAKLTGKYACDAETWNSKEVDIPNLYWSYGKDFQTYLNGSSQYQMKSVDEICQWLQQCHYARDIELFGKEDHWQHPLEFEELQKGDCEDHALWAWRKLINLGIYTEFVVGKWRDEVHAWIIFKSHDGLMLLESTEKTGLPQMLRPLEDAKSEYIPYFSIDGDLTRKLYSGALTTIDPNLLPHPDLIKPDERQGDTDQTKDSWGRDLIYQIDTNGINTLGSYGQDGKIGPGGATSEI